MDRHADSNEIAQLFLQVVPLAGRMFSSQLRHAGHNLSPGHFRLLMLLSRRPRNVSELAGMQGVSVPTMSNSISMLVERGWAGRVRDQADRRRVVIELSEEGRQILRQLRRELMSSLVTFCDALTTEECATFHAGLRAMLTVMHRAAERAGLSQDDPRYAEDPDLLPSD